jgi:HD-GYP domain-containing protein (c-di-GMP phosphodiesterase class II)
VFDDLTAEKPERTSLPINEALQQIEQQAGTAFDPTLTELFCRTMHEQPLQLSRPSQRSFKDRVLSRQLTIIR